MSIRKRTLAAAAAMAVAGITLAAPSALAASPYKNCDEARAAGASNIPAGSPRYQSGLDRNHNGVGCETGDPAAVVVAARIGDHGRLSQVGDPTTCPDGLLALVKVRGDEHGLGVRVGVLERDDAAAAKVLRDAKRADDKARDTRETTITNAQSEYTSWLAANPNATEAAKIAKRSIRDGKISDANAAYGAGGTAAALNTAQQDYNRKHSALLDIRAKLSSSHGAVVRLTVLVNGLCQHPVPVPVPTPEPTEEPAPVDTTPEPVIVNQPQTQIINNPSIGQVPTGSNTGGGAEAAIVE